MQRVHQGMRPRKLQIYPTGGPEARLKKLRQIITGLIRYERVEPTYAQADEARQYADQLIYLAVKNGDKHVATMEAADYWILDKDLIPKLFQVLVPRYQNRGSSSYTNLYKQAVEYPGSGNPLGVLELKGNPWPSVTPKPRDTQHILSNVLLSAARHDFYAEKRQKQSAEIETKATEIESKNTQHEKVVEKSATTESSSSKEGSSVDP